MSFEIDDAEAAGLFAAQRQLVRLCWKMRSSIGQRDSDKLIAATIALLSYGEDTRQ